MNWSYNTTGCAIMSHNIKYRWKRRIKAIKMFDKCALQFLHLVINSVEFVGVDLHIQLNSVNLQLLLEVGRVENLLHLVAQFPG